MSRRLPHKRKRMSGVCSRRLSNQNLKGASYMNELKAFNFNQVDVVDSGMWLCWYRNAMTTFFGTSLDTSKLWRNPLNPKLG